MNRNRIIRLNESELRNLVMESVKKTLKEYMDTNGEYVPTLKLERFCVKCVECYNEDGDIVFVAAISPNGEDNIAIKNVHTKFPHYEVVDVCDVDGVVEVGDMTSGQRELYDNIAILLGDNPIYTIDDLDW